MLSGESASGKYPELAVQTMRDILDRVDRSHSLKPLEISRLTDQETKSPSEMIAYIAADIARKMQVNAIVCLTLTGSMARLIAKYRPDTPIIAFSPRPDVVRKLSLVRGVLGILNNIFYDTDTAFSQIAKYIVDEGYAKEGDLLLITGGVPITQMLPSNTLKVHRIGANS